MSFTMLKRKVFEYTVKESTNLKILKELADNKVSITAYTFTLTCENEYEVKIVVGLPDDTSKDREWNKIYEQILQKRCVDYIKSNILEVLAKVSGISGVIYSILNKLSGKVTAEFVFQGELGNRFIRTNNIILTERLLSEL